MEFLPAIADLVFFLVAVFTAAVSLIMLFHWQKYSMSKTVAVFTEILYLGGTAVLLTAAFLGLN